MIEDLLGSKNKIKIARRLVVADEWLFNLSELARETGLNKGSISKIIQELDKKGVLEVNRSGKLLIFRLNKSHKEMLKKIFELEKRWKRE